MSWILCKSVCLQPQPVFFCRTKNVVESQHSSPALSELKVRNMNSGRQLNGTSDEPFAATAQLVTCKHPAAKYNFYSSFIPKFITIIVLVTERNLANCSATFFRFLIWAFQYLIREWFEIWFSQSSGCDCDATENPKSAQVDTEAFAERVITQ